MYEDYVRFKHKDKTMLSEGGYYYHLMYKKLLETNLPENYAVRLLYLATYVNYDNCIVTGQGGSLHELNMKEVRELLDLSIPEAIRTVKYLKTKGFLIEHEDGAVYINSEFCNKGKTKIDDGTTRLFEAGFRQLYKNVPPTSHKTMYLMVQILPYVNLHHNIICRNPLEVDKVKLDIMLWGDLGRELGLSVDQGKKLRSKIARFKINDKDCVAEFKTASGDRHYLLVNPRLFWGSNTGKYADIAALYD